MGWERGKAYQKVEKVRFGKRKTVNTPPITTEKEVYKIIAISTSDKFNDDPKEDRIRFYGVRGTPLKFQVLIQTNCRDPPKPDRDQMKKLNLTIYVLIFFSTLKAYSQMTPRRSIKNVNSVVLIITKNK